LVPDLVPGWSPLRDLAALRWIIDHLQAAEADVVHTHGHKAGMIGRLAARGAGVPVIHSLGRTELAAMAPDGEAARSAGRRLRLGAARWTAARSERLLVAGRADAELAEQLGLGDSQKRRLVRNGVELPDPEQIRQRRRRLRTELRLLGRLVVGATDCFGADCQTRNLVESFWLAALPQATLLLAGDGPLRPLVEQQVRELSERDPTVDIRLLGSDHGRAEPVRPPTDGPTEAGAESGIDRRVEDGLEGLPDRRMAELPAAFDLSVQTTPIDGLSRSALEAAASGLPIVAADCGSVSDLVVDGESGLLVDLGDPAALSRALIELADSPGRRRLLGDGARQRCRPFAIDRVRGDLQLLWREVASPAAANDKRDEAPAEQPSEPRKVHEPTKPAARRDPARPTQRATQAASAAEAAASPADRPRRAAIKSRR
jgi:glycosyltransferase involved in cell wall biosynthesis